MRPNLQANSVLSPGSTGLAEVGYKRQRHRTLIERTSGIALGLICVSPLMLDAQSVSLPAVAQPPAAPKSPWTTSASLTLKVAYDSNVYIQDTEPDSANVAAAAAAGYTAVEANKDSFVFSVQPRFGLDYRPCAAFSASASYIPDITYYDSASEENYVAHRGTLNFGGKLDKATWELLNTATYTDGNDLGPTFARPGDVPAIGGIPLRDRREAMIFRNGFKLTYPAGKFFLRPTAATYFHNFMTDQRVNPAPASWVYENYIDRQDVSGGLDLGYEVAKQTHVVLGYRYGSQNQGVLLGQNSPYDNTYQRILVGVEGAPAKWLKLAVLGGPDIRDFSDDIPSGFDDGELLYYVDASITVMPTARDSIVLASRRYEQPAFASFSMYEDIAYSLTWKHKLDEYFAIGAGFQLYEGKWQEPVDRDDWIYTPSASVTYTYKKFSAELAYSYDWVENKADVVAASPTAYADGREYTRHLVSLGLKYSF